MGIVGDRPSGTVVKGLFACSCRGRFDAWCRVVDFGVAVSL